MNYLKVPTTADKLNVIQLINSEIRTHEEWDGLTQLNDIDFNSGRMTMSFSKSDGSITTKEDQQGCAKLITSLGFIYEFN